MYKLSYEKCVCFIFLVILVFLSCSGFHTDRLVTLTDHNKKYPFTSSSSLNENSAQSQYDSEFITRLINGEMDRTQLAGVGTTVTLTEAVDQPLPYLPRRALRRHHHHLARRRNHANKTTATNSIITNITRTISTTTTAQQQQQQQQQEERMIRNKRATRSRANQNNRRRGEKRNRERNRERNRDKTREKFCPGQDIGTRAFHARTIIEGRVRSRKIPTNSTDYAVTVEVKKIHRNESIFRALNITDIIRLHFANKQHKGCDQKLIHGLVPAHLLNGKSYIFFLKSVGVHNYTVIGQPVPNDNRTVRQIKGIISGEKVRAARIGKPRITNETLKQNELLNLTCIVKGNPPPIITWFKDGNEIRGKRKQQGIIVKHTEKKSVLTIPKVDSSDAGRYECRAKGVIGKAVSTTAIITIQKEHSEGVLCPSPAREEYCFNEGTCFFYGSIGELACRCSNGFNGHRCENKDVSSQTSENLNV